MKHTYPLFLGRAYCLPVPFYFRTGHRLYSLVLLLGCLTLPHLLRAQAPAIQWDAVYGGTGSDNLEIALPTPDGGYLLGGSFSPPRTSIYNHVILKIDSNGSKQWEQVLYESDHEDQFSAVVQTEDGGYLVGGTSTWDYVVFKVNSAGQKQWEKRYGGNEEDRLNAIIKTTDGGYLLGGNSTSGIGGDKTEENRGGNVPFDYWIVKIDATGKKQWDRTYGGGDDGEGYSEGRDMLFSLLQTPDGGYLLGGQANSKGGDRTDTGSVDRAQDIWVVKTNQQGLKMWDRSYRKSGENGLVAMVAAPEGGYLLGGRSNFDNETGGNGEVEYLLIRISETGQLLWEKNYGGSKDDRLADLLATSDGGYLLGGSSYSSISGDKSEPNRAGGNFPDHWLVKVNGMGIVEWDKTIGGTGAERLAAVLPAADGGYLVAGSSSSGIGGDKTAPAIGFSDFWVVKLGTAAPEMRVTSFTLINADTDQEIQTLTEGDVLDLAQLPTANLNIRANVGFAPVGSVVFNLNRLPRYIENHAPYALFGNTGNDYQAGLLPVGSHTLRATPYGNTYGKGPAGLAHSVNFRVVGSRIQRLVLVNADTDQDVMELHPGSVIDYAVLGTRNINIRAETYPAKVGSVVFVLNYNAGSYGSRLTVRRENALPYALGGDHYPNIDDYRAFPLPVPEDSWDYHELRVSSYSGQNGTGERGMTQSLYLFVTEGGSQASQVSHALDMKGSGYTAFPNPFTDRLTLQLPQTSGPVQVTLVDPVGREVHRRQYAQQTGQVELDLRAENLTSGLYLLRLTTATGQTQVLKLMRR